MKYYIILFCIISVKAGLLNELLEPATDDIHKRNQNVVDTLDKGAKKVLNDLDNLLTPDKKNGNPEDSEKPKEDPTKSADDKKEEISSKVTEETKKAESDKPKDETTNVADDKKGETTEAAIEPTKGTPSNEEAKNTDAKIDEAPTTKA